MSDSDNDNGNDNDNDNGNDNYSDNNDKYDVESPRSQDGYQSHFEESYPNQDVKDHDKYGNPTYVAYAPRYAGQNATGRKYGLPTYNK